MSDADIHLKKFEKELAAGTVSLVLLAVLESAGEPLYGYQIAKQLERDAGGVLVGKQSALYPVLRSLSAAELLDTFVEPSESGPPRRYYRITPLGRKVLGQWTAAWKSTRHFVESILKD
jgi:PadR family transcriptional regulator PadR